ncbi:MAG TPA: hypothetical protein VFL99_17435 [Segeticoccus sp.]|uniref:hypothetical protein n=1 Tax=Segeticoccus sp. TaxID=2706531 RepID=UPI002D7E486C|nr:hypothetical protein [Segeticoccus sp.]HET8602110.1 hypothetical protein [Segeticoccus sp.]
MTWELTVRTALRAVPQAAFATHHTAARLLGGVVPDEPDVHLGSVGAGKSQLEGVVVHRHRRQPPLVRQHGIRVTSPARTFLDLADRLTLVDLVVLGDSLVKRGRCSPESLQEAARTWRGRAVRRARAAARLVRQAVDSPQETRTRLLMVFAGLPEPEINIEIRDEYGAIQRRIDLGYRAFKLAIEYDGRQHIERERAWGADILRREDLGNDGWRFVVLVSDDLNVSPADTLDRLVKAMMSAGMRVPRVKDDWRRHFPGRRQLAA